MRRRRSWGSKGPVRRNETRDGDVWSSVTGSSSGSDSVLNKLFLRAGRGRIWPILGTEREEGFDSHEVAFPARTHSVDYVSTTTQKEIPV